MTWRLIGVCSIVFLILFCNGNQTFASYITITPKIDIKFERNQLRLSIEVTNSGDESAFNIQTSAEVAGKVLTSGIREELRVKEHFTDVLSADLTLERPGRYPIFVTVSYTDANQYPFSALYIPTLVNKEATAPKILGILRGSDFATQGSAGVVIKNLDDQEKAVHMRFVLPKELSSSDLDQQVSLGPHSEVKIPLKMKNFSALPGSSYPIYAVLEYEFGGSHFTSTATGNVRIVKQDFVRDNKTFLIGVGILLAIAFVFVNVRSILVRRRRKGHA